MDFYHWYPEKYRLATRGLTPYQDGCYRRLIDEYMTTRRPLPASDAALADICRISIEQWTSNACSMLKAFFKEKNGLLFQENCDAELDRQDQTGKFRSERAKKGAEIRWSKNKDIDASSNACSNASSMLGDARVKSKDIEEDKSSSNPPTPQRGFELPDWIPVEVWKAFVEMRQRIRKPMTVRAKELIVSRLDKFRASGNDPVAVLERSIENSWQGVFELPDAAASPARAAPARKRTYSDDLRDAANIAMNQLNRESSLEID